MRGDPDREVADLADEVARARPRTSSSPCGEIEVLGRVAARGEDVVDPGVAVARDDLDQLGAGVRSAGEVRHRRHRRVAVDLDDEVVGALACRPAGAVGDRHVRRTAAARGRASVCASTPSIFSSRGGKNSNEKLGPAFRISLIFKRRSGYRGGRRPEPAESAQPQRVAHHEDAREAHRRRRDHRAEQPDRGQRDGGHVVGERPEQVALDRRRACAATSAIASAAARRSPDTSVRSLASMATSVPVPMAMPRSACASAGASFTPSPTTATRRPSAWSARTTSTFSPGQHPGDHPVDPDLGARPRRRSPGGRR